MEWRHIAHKDHVKKRSLYMIIIVFIKKELRHGESTNINNRVVLVLVLVLLIVLPAIAESGESRGVG